jgi:hypothetical protein
MKKFIFLSLTALLSVSVFLTGCPTEAEEKTVTVTADKLVYPDKVVATDADLAAALSNAAYKVIELAPSSSDLTLSTVTEIPAGKTVIITNIGSAVIKVKPKATDGLKIKGTVYVGSGGILEVVNGNPVIVSGGILNVAQGTLLIDGKTSVHNGATPTSATVLGRTAVINGGTLKYSAATEVDSDTEIAAALDFVASGTLDIGTSTLKLSELAVISGIGPSKGLKATSSTADSATTAAITIPAGADFTSVSGDTLAQTTSLTVNGKLKTDALASLAAATAVSVGNGGVLDIGVNTALNLPTSAEVTTSGTGKIVSQANVGKLQLLLSKAGTALNIEHGAAAVLATAATTVKAGTVLTLKASGAVTADNTEAGKLIVEGKIVLDGGSIATGSSNSSGSHYAINISGAGRIEAGDVVISGVGALYEATATAVAITITKANGVVGTAAGVNTLKGATTINAGNGKVVLSVDGGGATDTGTFTSAASNAALVVTGDAITLDTGTATANALKIGAKGKLAVGSGGIIKVVGANSSLSSAGSDAKLSIAAGAKVAVNGASDGTGSFTKADGKFTKGSIAAAINLIADSGFWKE